MVDRGAAAEDRLAAVTAAVRAGVDWVQVRDRSLGGAELLAFAAAVQRAARAGARASGRALRLLVNRRLDVALALGADGVHLGYDAVDPGTARRLLGPDALIGVSTHSAREARAVRGPTYAHLAPVFAPLSKAVTGPALGLAAVAAAARGPIPVIAQGGVTAENVAAVIRAGAAGAAVTGAVLLAADPAAAAAALRRALDADGR